MGTPVYVTPGRTDAHGDHGAQGHEDTLLVGTTFMGCLEETFFELIKKTEPHFEDSLWNCISGCTKSILKQLFEADSAPQNPAQAMHLSWWLSGRTYFGEIKQCTKNDGR